MARRTGGAVLFALAVSVASCAPSAPPPRLYWYKAGASQQDFARDDYQCRRENTVTGSETTYTPPNFLLPGGAVTSTPTVEVNPDLFARCMNARGWYLQPAATSAPRPAFTAPPEPPKKRNLRDQPECDWGQYWHSVKKQCVPIGTN